MKRTRFLTITMIVVVILTTILGAGAVSAQTVCSPATAISVPFTKDGTGNFCYQATSLCQNINSWNLDTLSVNGTNYTNIFVTSSSIAPLNGVYTITYNSSVAWGHFEIVGSPCSGGGGPTNTPPPAGATATRTNTPMITATTQASSVYQAESAVLGGGSFTESSNGGFNGSSYVNFPTSGGTLTFQNVNGGTGGSQTIRFRNALGITTSRTGQLTVNGVTQNITFDPTGSWTTWVYKDVVVNLNSGTSNTVQLSTNGQDLSNVDELVVGSSTGPTSTPVGPTATRTFTPTVVIGPTSTRTKTPTTGPTQGSGSWPNWPTPQGSDQLVTASIAVSGTFDGGMKRYVGSGPLGTGGQDEDQDALFELADGATLKNVILGNPAADGVHCAGNCTLQNVWWEDVGEDAATFRGSSGSIVQLVDGGGARHASDKVFQHNGAGTLTIRNFQVLDFGKLYRSCGNCSTQYQRDVIFQNIKLTAPGSSVAGINTNYGDTARFTQILIIGNSNMKVCDKYTGNNTGAEPPKIGTGADGVNCIYNTSDIIYQ